jgi:hypothetical protein
VQEIVSKLDDLKSCIKREKMGSVVEDIQKGDFVQACENVHQNFPNFHIGTMAELLQLGYSDIEHLKHVINFLKCIKHGTLAATGVVTVYEEMKFKGHNGHGEILLLQQEFGNLVELPRAIKTQIDSDCEKAIGRIVQDIATKEYSYSKYISETLGRRVLNTVLPLVIEQFFGIFSGTVDDILLLICYSQNLDNVLHTFEIVKNAEAKLKMFGLLNSEQALHLWIHATNKLRIKIDFKLGKNFSMLKQQYMSAQKYAFFEIYRNYLEGGNDGNFEQLHTKNTDLEEILVDFTRFYYDGSFEKTNKLLTASMRLNSLKANGYILHTLFSAMEKHKNVHSFEAFKIFHRLRRLDEIAKDDYTQELQELRLKVPRCIIKLLWGDVSKCRIINKYYREPLCSEEYDTCVVSWVPGGDRRKNQLWSMAVDKKTSMAKFTHLLKVENLSIGVLFKNIYAAVSSRGEDWMIKHADDQFFKIYTAGGEHLVHFCNKWHRTV